MNDYLIYINAITNNDVATLLEYIDPAKPTSSVRKRKIIKGKDTNVAREVISLVFKTAKGNKVDIHLEQTDQSTYNVIFYVNDTLFDDASGGRDTKIFQRYFSDKYNLNVDNDSFVITRK